jgi:hypothetical protein
MKHLHYFVFSALFLTPNIAAAKDSVLPCNPAKQNWVNGSGLACPFNSARGIVQNIEAQKIEVDVAPPPETEAPPDDAPK